MPNKKTTAQGQSDFTAFIAKIGGKDAALVIAPSEGAANDYQNIFFGHGFVKVKTIIEAGKKIEAGGKVILSFDALGEKAVYDFCAQYPTGQISVFDDNTHKLLAFNPRYQNGGVVVLTTEKQVVAARENNFNFTAVCGMTFCSK